LCFEVFSNGKGNFSWVDGKTLCDLDITDSIALLRDSWDRMQTITSTLENEAKKVGLVIKYGN